MRGNRQQLLLTHRHDFERRKARRKALEWDPPTDKMAAILSMTGYACSNTDTKFGRIGWTVKSVNHRFLDVTVSMPPGMESFWHLADETVRSSLSRGKVECSLSFVPKEEISVIDVNRELAAEVVRKADEIASMSARPGTLDPMQVLSWPGVVIRHSYSGTELEKALLDSLARTLSELIAFRAREGEKIKNVLLGKMKAISDEIQKVRLQLPKIVAWEKNRMKDAVLSAGVEIDRGRLEQELILAAQRIDVAEELDRLTAHISETEGILEKGGVVGRRLDFMMQEFNRESNTLASKSVNVAVTDSAVEIKVLIEQMREQIQNIE